MSPKDKAKGGKSPDEIAEEMIEEQVASLDEALEKVDKKLARYQKLNDTRIRLVSARRAMLGHGPRTTGGSTTKLTTDDVQHYVKENPGVTPEQIAGKFGVAQTTVSSNLYRNKQLYLKKDGRYWAKDPEAGLNTVDDIEEDDD